ncbi:MAG: hypothetical protein ACQEVA_08805, partial [Myxococcota bacterium]
MNRSTVTRLLALLCCVTLLGACAAPSKSLDPKMEAMAVQNGSASQPEKLEDNHFRTDRTGNLSEEDLKRILDSPIFLEEETRLGVVPVATAYQVDQDLPVNDVPHKLGNALEDTGFFEVATEVATDWQRDRGIAGLRELAARYRVKYLLLYRHRFEERARTNAWGWTMPTVLGVFATPHRTVEMAGVMEATLFDVRTGTILFTAYQRVHDEDAMSIWHGKHKRREMKAGLLDRATDDLQEKVTEKVRRLVASRPTEGSDTSRASDDDSSAPRGSVTHMSATG